MNPRRYCARCRQESPPGAKFCGHCGAALGLRCHHCSAELTAAMRFCGACGGRVGDEAAHGAAAALAAPPAARGQRRQLTVLFCDLVGSTEIATRLDPEEWSDIVAEYQRVATATLTRFGGVVAKYVGDGLVVYFGYPFAHDDDPERAIRAGLALVDAVRSLDVPSGNGAPVGQRSPLRVRVGLHTGPVVVVQGGGQDDEIFGETPNLAARLQAVAAADTVVISATALRLVRGIFVTEDLGPHRLKGFAEPVLVYRAVQPSGMRSRLDLAAGRLTPLVARQSEFGVLLDRWERCQERDGQTVLITGDAGVGKSRLVYEFRQRLGDTQHTWLECRCSPYTQETAFQPVIDLIEQRLGFTSEDTVAEKVTKLMAALGVPSTSLGEALPLFASLLSLPASPEQPAAEMHPEVQRRKTMEALVAWNLALSELQPMAVLIEDLHWCDPSSLEFFGRLIEQIPTARLMLIGTARPEFRSPWSARWNVTPVQLGRLTERQTRDMVQQLSGTVSGEDREPADDGAPPAIHSLWDDVVDVIVKRADGVPLYVEEITKMLTEAGARRSLDTIPTTLQDSLTARLDRLGPAKNVAQRAAVLGREFSYPLLLAVAGTEEATLRHALDRLVDAEILFVRGAPPTATYTFKHALVQEAAYESLLMRTRRELHGDVARVFIERFPERAAAGPEIVARHAQAARLDEMAVAYYQQAGEQAQARSAHSEAIGHFRKAIASLMSVDHDGRRDARELPLHMALGSSLMAARGWSQKETVAAWEAARRLCESAGDPAQMVRVLTGLISVYGNRGQIDRTVELSRQVVDLSEQTGDPEHRFVAHAAVAFPQHYQGRFASSLGHCEDAIAAYDRARRDRVALRYGTDPIITAYSLAARNLWLLGFPDRALVRAEESVHRARALEYPFSLGLALLFEMLCHRWCGNVERRDAITEETIVVSEAGGFPLWLGLARAFRAAASATSHAGPEVVREVMNGLAIAGRTGQRVGGSEVFALLADVHLGVRDYPAALNAIELGLATSQGQHYYDAELYRLKGEILLAQDPERLRATAEAQGAFDQAVTIARQQQARSLELRAATSLARLLCDAGKRADARTLLAPTYRWFTEGFATRDLLEAKALLERC